MRSYLDSLCSVITFEIDRFFDYCVCVLPHRRNVGVKWSR